MAKITEHVLSVGLANAIRDMTKALGLKVPEGGLLVRVFFFLSARFPMVRTICHLSEPA
jgi:hypothetical protein